MEEIFGYIESIVYTEEERGFTVARLKEPKKKELTCVVGYLPSIQPGESLRCRGTWKRHPQHGLQFDVDAFDLTAPSDLIGMRKYLESGMIRGIGPVYASRIVDEFGINTLDIIDKTPERLIEVPGLGVKRIERIKSCWNEQRQIREVMIFLRGHQVSPALAQKIFRAYGERSIDKVSTNPYGMAQEIFGIGFKTADQIGKNLGIAPDAPARVDAGIEHLLWTLTSEGHVCYPVMALTDAAATMLGATQSLIAERIDTLVQTGTLVRQNDLIWVRTLFLSESGIARELCRLANGLQAIRPVNIKKALSWVEDKLSLQLAIEQQEALANALSHKIHVITGGPGTGKSTITRAILAILSQLTGTIILAAPTGRAAKRMTEITGNKAFTIHSLLEMDFQHGGFKRNRDNPLVADLVIIDEASMIDTQLMQSLLRAIPTEARLILIGDVDQLPSVGPGNVLKDIISSACIGVTQLKQIFRQATGSRIITNAHRVNRGEIPDTSAYKDSDFFFLSRESPEDVLQTILDLVTIRLPRTYHFHCFDEIQVLAPMKKGLIGTENLNYALQEKLNPSPHALMRMGRKFHVGDKVMQIRNNYTKAVYNGDIGKILTIDLSEQRLEVLFEENRVSYDFNEIDELILAYAVSIHKYQGSESPCVVIPVHTSHFKLLHRNLLYTGITRGKKLVVLVGSKKALAIAVKNDEVKLRYTGLMAATQATFNTQNSW